jgi:hypothetical protein
MGVFLQRRSKRGGIFALLGLGACCLWTTRAEAQLKIGTVDVSAILRAYGRMNDAEAKFTEEMSKIERDQEVRRAPLEKDLAEVEQLDSEIENLKLNEADRKFLVATRDRKIDEARKLDEIEDRIEIDSPLRRSARAAYEKTRVALSGEVLEEVRKLAADGHYDLVFDLSVTPGQFPRIPCSPASVDFTQAVIIALNVNH